ncbi:MAG: response regulator [Anaerolineae bacterium]|jgi:CheY-like chemotaxis protein
MGYHILIVDNDPLMRVLFCSVLLEERVGDRVETASSASEALMVMHRKPADVLITAGQIPGTDGISLIERVQALFPKTHAILLTTADQDEIRERRRNRQVSFTSFTEPFSIGAFLEHIDQILPQKTQLAVALGPAGADPVGHCESRRGLGPKLRPAFSSG